MKRNFYILTIIAIVVLAVSVISLGDDAKKPYVIGAFVSVSGPNAPLGTP